MNYIEELPEELKKDVDDFIEIIGGSYLKREAIITFINAAFTAGRIKQAGDDLERFLTTYENK